jgi:hypothetical protein
MGDGQHGWAAAELLTFVRDLLLREEPGGLVLMPLVPEGWYGQGWEVHDAPTEFGRLSYAVRWHGDRVALLWELAPHAGQGAVRLRAPGFDPEWSSTEATGEALLGPVVPPGTVEEPAAATVSAGPAGEDSPPDPPPEGSFA